MNKKPAIVFVHGLFRLPCSFGHSFDYFRGVNKAITDLPASLHFPLLPLNANIDDRAAILAKFLDSIDSDTIFLIGHSMGGLVCRYYANQYPDDQRIKRITTVATPHHGSPLANWVMQSYSPVAVISRSLLKNAIPDLTTTTCKAFNKDITDRSNIQYISYAAQRPHWELPVWMWVLLAKHAGDESSDGLVPVSSAQWGEFAGLLLADHLEATGWSIALPKQAEHRPFNHLDFYRRLINEFLTDIAQATAGATS